MSELNDKKVNKVLITKVWWFKFTLLMSIFSGALAAFFFYNSVGRGKIFYGIKFPQGKSSFADAVVSYDPIIYHLHERQLPNVEAPFDNPVTALGTPNSSHPNNSLSSPSERHDVALGLGGSITLKFTDNLLTGSGSSKADLWIFEAGKKTEAVLVEISKDGSNWHPVGRIDRQTSGIDIDAFGWGTEDFFAYVRLTDDPLDGEHDGVFYHGKWIGWGGADIDAVGAISSVSLVPSVHTYQ